MRLTAYDTLAIFLNRGKLPEESMLMLRLRVAMRVADRLYNKVAQDVDEVNFPCYLRWQLSVMAQKGRPHMLAEELEDVAVSWEKGETFAELFARARMLQAKRVIQSTKYGGRRG